MGFTANRWTRALAAGAMVLALGAGAAAAQEADDVSDRVIARVNGDDVTFADLEQIRENLGQQIGRMSPDQQFSVLLNIMIDARLMARAAEVDGLADDPTIQRRLANERDSILRQEYLRQNVVDAITDEAVEAAFADELAAFAPSEQRRARHILVETEDEASGIITDLDGGADFSEIAQEKSLDPGSGRNGGDLGFFGRGDMVPPFDEAAFGLDVGAYTPSPVESRFGWHVIVLDEVRDEPAPTLADRAPAIRQEMLQQGLIAASEALRAAAEIEVFGADGEPIDQ